MRSCLVPASSVDGAEVTTIEGLAKEGKLHPIQQSFIDEGAVQCGFCSPAMILSAKALLDEDPHPDEKEGRGRLERPAGNDVSEPGKPLPKGELGFFR